MMDVSIKDDVKNFLQSVCERQTKTFKIQISIGLLLKNWKTDKIIYLPPFDTHGIDTEMLRYTAFVLKKPRSIVNTQTALDFIADMDIDMLYETAMKARLSSDWVICMITNLGVFVTHLNRQFNFSDLVPDKTFILR